MIRYSSSQWRQLRSVHEARVEPWIRPAIERRGSGQTHPIHDFLFTYYSFRPALLRRWSPGAGVILETDAPGEWLRRKEWAACEGGVTLSLASFPEGRRAWLPWLVTFLEATGQRSPWYGCHGLHEWAMVYRASKEEIRHPAYPLRLGFQGVAGVVEGLPLVCTHYDALRFFTAEARPRNRLAPTRESQRDFDQPACVHVTMDLYKWCYKLYPWIASEIIADAFELAATAREIDMRASPYDFGVLGYPPIPIETERGRLEYQAHQRDLAMRAAPLRTRLLEISRALLEAAGP
jgi:hypothetical protein